MSNLFRTPSRTLEQYRLPAVPNRQTPFDDGNRGNPLMAHVNRGPGTPVAVLVTAGVVTEHATPTSAQTAVADYVYLGGHDNIISDAERATLEAAGYTVLTV